MSFTSTLRQLFGSTSGPGPGRVRNHRGSGASRRVQSRRLSLKSLECREVFSTDLLSAFAIGNNTGNSSVDFDPGSKTNWQSSGVSGPASYVLNLNSQGNFRRVSVFQSSAASSSVATDVALDSGGNTVVGGYYGGPVDFNPGSGITRLSSGGAYVTKLNQNGGLV